MAGPDVFDDHACLTAGLFGLQAATLLYGTDRAAGLNQALQTRDVIGHARGILRERFDVTDDAAFQMLVRSSQETNIKLHNVAHWFASERDRRAPKPPGETTSHGASILAFQTSGRPCSPDRAMDRCSVQQGSHV